MDDCDGQKSFVSDSFPVLISYFEMATTYGCQSELLTRKPSFDLKRETFLVSIHAFGGLKQNRINDVGLWWLSFRVHWDRGKSISAGGCFPGCLQVSSMIALRRNFNTSLSVLSKWKLRWFSLISSGNTPESAAIESIKGLLGIVTPIVIRLFEWKWKLSESPVIKKKIGSRWFHPESVSKHADTTNCRHSESYFVVPPSNLD